jgi:hypothetical protein
MMKGMVVARQTTMFPLPSIHLVRIWKIRLFQVQLMLSLCYNGNPFFSRTHCTAHLRGDNSVSLHFPVNLLVPNLEESNSSSIPEAIVCNPMGR